MLRSGNRPTRGPTHARRGLAREDSGNSISSTGKGIRMDTEPSAELITVQAAADRLAVSRWMVYRLIWDRQVKSVQIGRCRRIVRKSLDDYIAGLIDGAA
jgi:excisionase family DNA binding protein